MKNKINLLLVIVILFVSGCNWNASPTVTMTPPGTNSLEMMNTEAMPTQVNQDLSLSVTTFPTRALSPSATIRPSVTIQPSATIQPGPTSQPTATPVVQVIQHQDFVEFQFSVFYEPLNQDKAFLDFDSGTVAFQENSGSDGVISVGAGSMVFWGIRPLNGAKISWLDERDFGEGAFSKEECFSDKVEYFTGGYPLGNRLAYCWITTEGQSVEVWVKQTTDLDNNQRAQFVIYYFISEK